MECFFGGSIRWNHCDMKGVTTMCYDDALSDRLMVTQRRGEY